MKWNFLILALLCMGAPARAEDQALTNLKKCQALAKVPLVRIADYSDHQAEADLRAAFKALSTYEASCTAVKTDQVGLQNNETTSRLGAEGNAAATAGRAAEDSVYLALLDLHKAAPAVEALGNKECAADMRQDIHDLEKYKRQLDDRKEGVKNCDPNASQDPCTMCMAQCPHQTRDLKACDRGCPEVCAPKPRPGGAGGR